MPVPLPMPGDPAVVYLLDLSSLMRALFATLEPLSTHDGEPVAVTAAVVNRLARLFNVHRPAFLAVCADGRTAVGDEEDPAEARRRRYWRARVWPPYKAEREPPGGEYDAQVDRVLEILQAHRIPVFRAEGYEADDFIGALVPPLVRLGLRVVVMSKDQDLWQLLGQNVVAWDGTSTEAIGPADVEAAYGVPPELLADLLALAGDDDEAPGLPHVGRTTAARLLNRHRPRDRVPFPGEVLGTVLRCWQWECGAKGKVTKVAEALRDRAADARLSLQLVLLGEHGARVPLDLDLAELRVGWSDSDAELIRALGAELSIAIMRGVDAMPKRPLPQALAERWLSLRSEE